MNAEQRRLEDDRQRVAHWKRWGPYVADRAWGTVREDYSPSGTAWEYLPHDHARSRAYRWNEDGVAGVSDRHQEVCLALALWNGRDPILKERLFGLTGNEGNHGEDVKEYYFYLDSTPTHSYMRMLYKYPQAEFPYVPLVEENRRRGRGAPEFELVDTGVFDGNHYFDVVVEYAKADVEDLVMRVTVTNHGPEPAPIHVLPTVWFRNTWSWSGAPGRPTLGPPAAGATSVTLPLQTRRYGPRDVVFEATPGSPPPPVLVTENETNVARLFGADGRGRYFKDGINDHVVDRRADAVNPDGIGTKAAAHYRLDVPAGGSIAVKVRLAPVTSGTGQAPGVDAVIAQRRAEADEFYADVVPASLGEDAGAVMRQSLAGMLWSKQFYHYVVKTWLDGDQAQPPPPPQRGAGRNHEWTHLFNADVLSMPDKWEYPWYAAWDLAFHMIPMATVDPEFAKRQLELFLREWYLHPNGQMPAYEWALSDVNPPVHAWACWRVYKMTAPRGERDIPFLKRVFTKLLLNFTWWVNRKDVSGKHLFAGGFLGLDNIGVFDRSKPLPGGGGSLASPSSQSLTMYW